MKLTHQQKMFILENFFEDNSYAGWRNIANALLDNGSCIVPGYRCIWQGGIGNFIEIERANEYINCVKYVFDLSIFLSARFFKDIKDHRLEQLSAEKEKIQQKINEISEL